MMGLIIGGVALAAFFALILGVFVMWLWNWLMPEIFGLKQISYWQAFGLLFLGRLLFGGFGHHQREHDSTKFRRWIERDRRDRWKHYDHFWHERGEVAANDLIKRAKQDGSPGEG
ncbi:MAG: hypothetical protein JW950_14275 [Deltaproteobacteria bacterium]|nr:hypothetical protein [Deltaproteobacteria bacterium]